MSSLPEVAGDGALMVDPEDESALSAAMARLEREPGLRQELTERGLINARRFSWEACARTVLGVIRQVVV